MAIVKCVLLVVVATVFLIRALLYSIAISFESTAVKAD